MTEIVGSLIGAASERLNSLLNYIYCAACGVLAWLALIGSMRAQSSVTQSATEVLLFLGVSHVDWLNSVHEWIVVRQEMVGSVAWLLFSAGILRACFEVLYSTSRTGSTILLGAVAIWESTGGQTSVWAILWIAVLILLVLIVVSIVEKRVGVRESLAAMIMERLIRPVAASVIGLLVPLSAVFWLFGRQATPSPPGTYSFEPLHVQVKR